MAERNNLTTASWQGREPASGGERSAEEIRQDIAARRESITEAVDRLSDRFQRTLDWRAYVSDYPLAALGVAAGLGFLAARIAKHRPSPAERMMGALADGVEDLAGRFRHQLDGLGPRHSGGLGGTVKAAATGLITKAVTDYLRNRLVADDGQSPEYAPEYFGRYPGEDVDDEDVDDLDNFDYSGSELDDWPIVHQKDSERRH